MSQISTLDSIFGTPIQAIIDADYMAAVKSAEYIKNFGFNAPVSENKLNSELGSLKETVFSYNTIGNDGKMEQRLVKIPSLSLIPLPLLHVEQADFDFSVRIVSSSEGNEDGKLKATLVPQKGDNSRNKNAPHLDANIHVKMKVVQSDIPAGLSNLLALMGTNTTNVALNKLILKDPSIKIENGKYYSTSLTLYDFKGVPIKNAPVTASFENSSEIMLVCDRKKWNSNTPMQTNDNGEIHYIVAYSSRDPSKNNSTLTISFSHENCINATQNLYTE